MTYCKTVCFRVLLILFALLPGEYLLACNTLSVNGGDNWFPYFYRGDEGELGIIGDIVQQAAHRTDLTIEVANPAPWKRILFDLGNGRLDIIAGALKTKEREKQFLFSNPVFYAELRIFVDKNAPFSFSGPEDLLAKRGIKIRGMSLGQELDDYAFENLVIEETNDTNSLFKMIAAKRVDYGIFYLQSGLIELNRLRLNKKLAILPTPLNQEPLFVAFSKESKCQPQILKLSREIDLMLEDGSIQKISNRYTQHNINQRVIKSDE